MHNFKILLIFFTLLFTQCQPPVTYHTIPAPYVYSIVEHNDSIYYSTPAGEICRFNPDNPDSITLVGMRKFYPIRGFGFKKDGTLYTSSYQGGVCRVQNGVFVEEPKMRRTAWTMKIDKNDNLWLAGREGIFRQVGDTLIRFTGIRQGYDIDFFAGSAAIGHRTGITHYDTASGKITATSQKKGVFWSVHVFDSLLAGGCLEACLLTEGNRERIVPIGPKNNTPWSIVRDNQGNLLLGTQKGLFRIKKGGKRAECIGFKGKCVKALLIDRKNRLWVGKYFD